MPRPLGQQRLSGTSPRNRTASFCSSDRRAHQLRERSISGLSDEYRPRFNRLTTCRITFMLRTNLVAQVGIAPNRILLMRQACPLGHLRAKMVGNTGLEPVNSSSQTRRDSHYPNYRYLVLLWRIELPTIVYKTIVIPLNYSSVFWWTSTVLPRVFRIASAVCYLLSLQALIWRSRWPPCRVASSPISG